MAVITRSSRRSTPRPALTLLAAALALGSAACASSSSGSKAAAATPAASSGAPKPSPNLITADEISRINVQNAYEAVQKLRPSMLRPRQVASANGQGGVSSDAPGRGGTGVTSGELIVYMDGTRLGALDQLRNITASTVASVRYYSASEAQMKWGSGHPGGVIEVTTKR